MKHNQMRQVVLPILAAFIWGTAFVAQDVCADAMGAFTFNGTRYYIAVLSLLVVLAVSSGFKKDRPQISPAEKKAQRRQLWLGGFCCGTVLAIASNFQQAGLVAGTDGGKAGFITALYVVLVPVFGLFLGRKGSAQLWVSMVVAVLGLYLLCMKNGFGSIESSDWLLLSCAVLFSFQIIAVDHFSPQVDGVRLSLAEFLVVSVESTAAALLFETPSAAQFAENALPILYCGIMSSGVAYTLQILGQRDLNPAIASLIMCLESVFSALGGWMLLHQNLSAREVFGCVLIFAAVVLAQLPLEMLHRAKKTT